MRSVGEMETRDLNNVPRLRDLFVEAGLELESLASELTLLFFSVFFTITHKYFTSGPTI